MKTAATNLKVFFITVFLVMTFYVVTHAEQGTRVDIENLFSSSGWMGDGEYGRKYIKFSGADTSQPHSPPSSIKITYHFGPKRWAGIYWLNKPDNWGDTRGNDYSGKEISRVTFWAKGATGNELVEFKSGNIDNSEKKYRDSFDATTGRVRLSNGWRMYEIDLSDADLSSVIGGFCWVASQDYNQGKSITFYIDDIAFK